MHGQQNIKFKVVLLLRNKIKQDRQHTYNVILKGDEIFLNQTCRSNWYCRNTNNTTCRIWNKIQFQIVHTLFTPLLACTVPASRSGVNKSQHPSAYSWLIIHTVHMHRSPCLSVCLLAKLSSQFSYIWPEKRSFLSFCLSFRHADRICVVTCYVCNINCFVFGTPVTYLS